MTNAMSWERDGPGWPHAAASRFVTAGGVDWHVQVMGDGPTAFLIHGTGASTHSWRGLAPLLAARFTIVMADLPGHGFTSTPASPGLTLPGMAQGCGALLRALGLQPSIAIGHSAGAAVAIRMTLDGLMAPRLIVSLNGALKPLRGPVTQFFSPIAKVLFLNPLTPRFFAWNVSTRTVERLLRDTGSRIDAQGVRLYERLFRSPSHVAGALGMMANWDLSALERDMARLKTPLALLSGGADRSISPDDAYAVRDAVPGATADYFADLGHLAHEEAPERIAAFVMDKAIKAGALDAAAAV